MTYAAPVTAFSNHDYDGSQPRNARSLRRYWQSLTLRAKQRISAALETTRIHKQVVYSVPKHNRHASECSAGQLEDDYTYYAQIQYEKNGEAKMIVHNGVLAAKLDTGSTKNFIGQNLVRRLNIKMKDVPHRCPFKNVDGSLFHSPGQVELCFLLRRQANDEDSDGFGASSYKFIKAVFYILPTPPSGEDDIELLIGSQCLMRHGLCKSFVGMVDAVRRRHSHLGPDTKEKEKQQEQRFKKARAEMEAHKKSKLSSEARQAPSDLHADEHALQQDDSK